MLNLLSSLAVPFLLLSSPTPARAQDFTSNATSFLGTWSTGSGAVATGPVSLRGALDSTRGVARARAGKGGPGPR